MSESMGRHAMANQDFAKVTGSETGESTKAIIKAKDQIDTPCSRRETTSAFVSLGGRTEVAQTLLTSGALIGINARHYETHDHLSDHEVWEKLRESGRRNFSSREFADRPSTTIDSEIFKTINRPAFGQQDEASTRPVHEHNALQLRQSNLKTRNSLTPPDHAGMRRATHADAIRDFAIERERWKNENINTSDFRGNTPLHRAIIESASPPIIEFLINKGMDVNARNKKKETALFIAVTQGNTELVKVLPRRGADPNIETPKKKTRLKVASANQKTRKRKRNTGRCPRLKEKRYRWEKDWLSEITEGNLR